MSIRHLDRLFQPRSVAVIGASSELSSVGRTVLTNLADETFPGAVYPVNPKHESVDNLPCFRSILDIHDPVDLAVICTPAETVPAIIDECGHAGVTTAIILSAGFREIGPKGMQLESEIRSLAAKHSGMRIVGPNCLGILSPYHGLNASFARRLPKPGRTAFISQSGALCAAILDWAIDEGIGFSAVASVGNTLDVDLGDMIDYLATDPYTDSIVLYVESIHDARKFMSAARAFTRTKPIVAYKAGRFAASARAAASHTGAMVGEDSVYDAAFARAGIVRVNDMNELFSSAEVLARGKLPKGPQLAIVSNAGGPGIMATDALLSRHGTIATLSHATIESLNQALPDAWSHQNPVDILGDAPPARYGIAVDTVLKDDGVDGLIVLLTPQAMTDPTESANAIIASSAHSAKPVLAVWMGGSSVRSGIQRLNQAGIPTFESPEQAVAAFECLVQYGRRRDVLYETPHEHSIEFSRPRLNRDAMIQQKSGLLNEVDSKAILAAYDIPVNETRLAADPAEAVEIAKKLNCPVAMKVMSPDISHKTNVGGVILNVKGDSEVEAAFDKIIWSATNSRPGALIEGVSVQPMVVDPNSIELIVGMKRDPTFGAVLMLGSGGTMVELVGDRVVELPPLNDRLARRMLESMRMWPLLNGYRKRPKANIEKLIDTLIRLSYLVAERPEIMELDINPLVVTPSSVVAVDARIAVDGTLASTWDRPYQHLAIRPYPSELVRNVKLDNGQLVTLRPIRPEDEEKWIQLLNSCSPATIHDRFGGLIHSFDHQFASRYCFTDYDREIAMVAEIGNERDRQLIGVGRLIANADRVRASLVLLVGDAWQHHGLGSMLADACLDIAKGWKITQVIAETTTDNFRAREIFQERKFNEVVGTDGTVIVRRQMLIES
ncbi:MAG: bifunctional acetate--CoA ligase family protein/GNAT family N-acetyltransferase [Pirellulaceae bacterium]|nr:bifunctional acetate--CoA ligase family protein/GNAT family N-acetyltransferase [Pirellulaceae bacterium]